MEKYLFVSNGAGDVGTVEGHLEFAKMYYRTKVNAMLNAWQNEQA